MNKAAFVTAVAGTVLVVDQLTKWFVRRVIPPYETIPVIDGLFAIVHVYNPGGAFSLLAGASDAVRVPFFFAASALAIGALVYFLRHIGARQRWLLFAVAAVLGGALGNLVDRVAFGHVTDFLLVHYGPYQWPAFNVADSFISIGVAILIGHSIFSKDPPEQAGTEPRRA